MNMDRQDNSGRERSRRFVIMLLVSALPLVLAYLGFENGFLEELSQNRMVTPDPIPSLLGERHESNLMNFAFPFGALASEAQRFPAPEEHLKARFEQWKEAFPGWFETVLFDGDGHLIASWSDRPELHPLLEEFAGTLRFLRAGNLDLANRMLSRFRPVLGPLIPDFRGLMNAGLVGRASFSRHRGLFCFCWNSSGMPLFLAWVSFPPDLDPNEALVRFLLFRTRNEWREYRRGVIDLQGSPESWKQELGDLASLVPQVVARGESIAGRSFFLEGQQWWVATVTPTKKLVIALPDSALEAMQNAMHHLRMGICGVFTGLVLIYGIFLRFSHRTLSLRAKVFCLFLYTAGIPLFLLITSAKGLFLERRQALERREFQEHEKALEDLDRLFTGQEGLIEEVTSRRTGIRRGGAPWTDHQVADSFRRLSRRLRAGAGYLVGLDGKDLGLFLTGGFEQVLRKVIPMFQNQTVRQMQKMNGLGISSSESARDQAIQATAESLGMDLEAAGSVGERFEQSIISMKIGGSAPARGMNLNYRDPAGKQIAGGMLFWDGGEQNRHFIRRIRKSFERKWEGFQLGWFADADESHLPQRFSEPTVWLNMRNLQARDPAVPLHETMVRDGRKLFLTLGQVRHLDFPLGILSTDEKIEAEIHATGIRLGLVGIVVMGLGMGIGWLIFTTFLRPIGLLGDGIEAMARREFRARVPLTTPDEFGQVALAFNKMMEGMADLEIARVVQDSFFPQTPLQRAGWEAFGTSVSASKVGGDYFDYFSLPDGRWMILIGDVSGHGVAAALGVAMVKALTFHNADQASPGAILDRINPSFMQALKKKRHMTLFLASFDPGTGLLVATNAGHPFPFIVRGGEAREIALVNTLLGFKNRRPFQELTISLQPCETVCLYTDGLIEALDVNGVPIGYDRFARDLPGLRRNSASETAAAIRGWFARNSAPGPLADDVTLVILQRSEGEKAPPLEGESL